MTCCWITSDLVRAAMGRRALPDEAPEEDYYLEQATDAANDYAYNERAKAGFVDDATNPPSEDVRLGTITYARRLYMTGPGGDAGGFEEFGSSAVPTMSEVWRLLHCRRALAS